MAEKIRFIGRIQHTEDTIQRLFKTEYFTYSKRRILARMLVGAAMVVTGLLYQRNRIVQVILLMIGCWLLFSRDFPASVQADRTLEKRKGRLPQNTCTFFDSGMDLDGEGRMRLAYSRFQQLVEDERYLYLFLGKGSVCMIDKETIERGSVEELKEFVEKHTGLTWRAKSKSLLQMNLYDVWQMLQDKRRRR